jgi:GR25 family glycosyltransferase involved in LPS biosynthesis
MEIKGLDKIYIIHYIKLKERRAYLEKRLKELGLEKYAVWVVSTKDGIFTKKEIASIDKSEKAIKEREKYLVNKIPPIGNIDGIMMLQHMRIVRKIAARKNKLISAVFEDDVLLDSDFSFKLQKAITCLSKINWDICYCDRGSLLVEPKANICDCLFSPKDRRANTTGAYLLGCLGAKKLNSIMKKTSLGPDMELTYVQRKHKLKVYWTIPFLTHQGSIEEIYSSNVRTGSLAGRVIKINKKIEKFSPGIAKVTARIADCFLKFTYKSKVLFLIKEKIKKLMGFHLNKELYNNQ